MRMFRGSRRLCSVVFDVLLPSWKGSVQGDKRRYVAASTYQNLYQGSSSSSFFFSSSSFFFSASTHEILLFLNFT